MPRTNGEGRLKKHDCCLTCSIICVVLLVVFFVALFVGGTILFNHYVSPQIGGLKLNDAIALTTNVLAGKEAKSDYTEEDLDSFYSGLSDALFLSDKSEFELEYELVPDETRATLAASYSPVAAAEEEDAASSEETDESAYDEDAAYASFCLKPVAERYALLPEDTRALITQAEFAALAGDSDADVAARAKVGLKPYRLSVEAIMKDMKFGAEDFDAGKAMEKSLSSLEFNFDTLAEYDIDNAAASQNEKFTTFSVNGKQASAFINDVIAYLLSSENSPLTSMLNDKLPVDIALKDYVKVASVTIMNTPLATLDGEAAYDQKDTALGVSVSIKLRALVKAALETEELKARLAEVPAFAVNLIPTLVPKNFSANVTVFPLAPEQDGREVIVTFNKPSDKNAKRLSILVNALFGKASEETTEEGEGVAKTFFGSLNDTIVSTFSSINNTVKINFVASKDSEGNPLKDEKGNTYSEMKIMTWQTVLSLIDKEGNLSAHEMLTMLKCLYISNGTHTALDTDAAMAAFKTDASEKYGIDKTYLDEHNILDTNDLKGVTDHVDLSKVTMKENSAEMRGNISSEALAAFMAKYVSKEEESSDSSVAAAEEESSGSGTSSLLAGLDLTITDVTIDKVSEENGVAIYSFELGMLVNLQKMVEDKIPSDGVAGTLTTKLLPKKDSYFCIMLYISEYTDAETGKLTHKVGKNIDNPAEGTVSSYASKIRLNDFSYAETSRVFDTLNSFMQTLSGSSYDVTSITSSLEDTVNGVFTSIGKNDFNMELRLYQKSAGNRGGMTLPSLYELLKSVVDPKLNTEQGETFDVADARNVLLQIYQPNELNVEVYYSASQATDFVDEINDKYYIKKASALSVTDLFGSGASNLSTKITSSSIYFKPDAEEAALWDAPKLSLYGDTRNISSLRIRLSGTAVAALVEESNMIPADVAASFGTLEVLGAKFNTVNNKTYLTFDLKLIRKEDSSDLKFGKAFPADVKLSATILLHAPSYSEAEPRYSTTVKLNDENSEKAFILLRALGGDSLSEKAIADKISESIATTFNTLEGKIPLYYIDEGTGDPYHLAGVDSEQCILISDVFSFLIKETNMTDSDSSATNPEDLALRMQGFGKQAFGDSANAGVYTWLNCSDDIFDDNDDLYIYQNMQRAYFLSNPPDIDTIYGSGTSTFASMTTSIDDGFNLKGVGGLCYYDGDIKKLKISGKALGVVVKKKQSFAGTVAGAGMTPEIMSLKLSKDGGNDVIESGIKIAFDTRSDYLSMPSYFFVIARTVRSWDSGESKYVFTTALSMNNLTTAATDELFYNIQALGSKGVNTSSFNKADIVNTINTAIENAFQNLPASVDFGTFSSGDMTNEYNSANYGALALPTENEGCLSFPSIYSYIIDMFYTTNKPTEEKMQHMICALNNPDVETDLITNPKSSTAYNNMGMKGAYDPVYVFSDKYLAHYVSTQLNGITFNGNIDLTDCIEQAIVLRHIDALENQGERTNWNNRFFTTNELDRTHDYIILTVKVSLAGYSSGGASILPDNLYYTVLMDMTINADSDGLLYDMDNDDMAIFQYIMSNNNAAFNIKNMAVELVGIINGKFNTIKAWVSNGTFNYRLATDSFSYTEGVVYDSGNLTDVSDIWNDDGIGYIVIANGTI